MGKRSGTIIGKSVRVATRLRPHGGHALPGLVVQKIMPNYTRDMLKQLPNGVVLVTGTNGKTTTTKILVEILKANGQRVITNSTGSNMVRGIASSLIRNSKLGAKLPYDIAVFELDEASAKQLVAAVKPRWVLALNVSRDQLDRFGEVDTIAKHVGHAMEAATEGIITNADDPNLLKIAKQISQNKDVEVGYFGVSQRLLKYFPSDYDMAAVGTPKTSDKGLRPELAVELANFKANEVTYKIDSKNYITRPKLSGQHNFQNGAAALALAKKLLHKSDPTDLVKEMARVSIAFGRGESYKLKNGAIVELVLVKNPASFRQALASYAENSQNLMITINDNIADGRDTSWLWDVDFKSLDSDHFIVTSGTRAADMALRLKYDEIKVNSIQPKLSDGLLELSNQVGSKVILATYTAMLSQYKYLNKVAEKI